MCKLREFSNHKLIAEKDAGSFRTLFLFIPSVRGDKFSSVLHSPQVSSTQSASQ